jgi:hypothetical protein
MTPPRSKVAKARSLPPSVPRSGATSDPLRLSSQGEEIVVWLQGKGMRPKRIGSVNRRLADDARRHGQDLVGDLVDMALLEADRRGPAG